MLGAGGVPSAELLPVPSAAAQHPSPQHWGRSCLAPQDCCGCGEVGGERHHCCPPTDQPGHLLCGVCHLQRRLGHAVPGGVEAPRGRVCLQVGDAGHPCRVHRGAPAPVQGEWGGSSVLGGGRGGVPMMSGVTAPRPPSGGEEDQPGDQRRGVLLPALEAAAVPVPGQPARLPRLPLLRLPRHAGLLPAPGGARAVLSHLGGVTAPQPPPPR